MPPDEQSVPKLRMSTPIDAEFMEHLNAQLFSILYDRLAARHRRVMSAKSLTIIATGNAIIARGLAIILILLTLAWLWLVLFLEPSDPKFAQARTEMTLFVTAVGLSSAVLSWKLPRYFNRFANTPWPRCWTWAVKATADRMLKTARACAPFRADYEFRGDQVVYFRVQADRTAVAWNRPLRGWSLEADGFSLLFKKENRWAPYCIILHEPSAELSAYLRNLGIQPIAKTAAHN